MKRHSWRWANLRSGSVIEVCRNAGCKVQRKSRSGGGGRYLYRTEGQPDWSDMTGACTGGEREKGR